MNTAVETLIIQSECLGRGDDKLGGQLMKNYLYTLARQSPLPKEIFLLNSGVKLACKGSDSLEDLKLLEDAGVSIASCGTCLNYFELSHTLECGTIGSMAQIVNAQMSTSSLLIG